MRRARHSLRHGVAGNASPLPRDVRYKRAKRCYENAYQLTQSDPERFIYVARSAGLTGAPDESGQRRREKGLARAGNARVRRAMIQLAWRFLMFQKDSALAQWYRARTEGGRRGVRKTMIVALARKLLIALWRMVTTGEVPAGVLLHPAR